MNIFEELCDEVFCEHIELHRIDIPVEGMSAVYIRSAGKERIFMRDDGTENENACWLAEELGHHYTGPSRVLHYNAADDWRAEAKARRWAHARILTPDAIRTAARNTDDIYEIADALCVTVDFLMEAISDYITKGLWPSSPAAL